MKKILSVVFLSISIFSLLSCSNSSSNSSTPPPAKITISTTGSAQKGPLILNSTILVQELEDNLTPNGKQYTYQTDNDLGTFDPSSSYSSKFLDIYATGYYFDEILNQISSGTLVLQSIADLETDAVLNVNLLSTLAYQRIKTLVTKNGMTIAAARAQAESEVLRAFGIHKSSLFSNFGSLDISNQGDGDNFLTAVSSIFVYGNNAGNLTALMAAFRKDLADNGVIDSTSIKNTIATSAKAINPQTVADNLTAKYVGVTNAFSGTEIQSWIDNDNDGVIQKFEAQVNDATTSSSYTLPAAWVSYLAGQALTLNTGVIKINNVTTTGTFTVSVGDIVSVSPATESFVTGIAALYLKSGSTNLARVKFLKGVSAISISPAVPKVPVGLTQKLSATATFVDSTSSDVTNNVTWSSSDSSFASINTAGVVYGVAAGNPQITAAIGSANTSVTVNVTAGTLQTITITPSSPYTGIGLTEQLTATGDYGSGTLLDITDDVAWSTSNISVATVNASSGLVTGVGLGWANITASFGTVTGTRLFNVTSNPWSATTSMSSARFASTLTVIPGNKAIAIGGCCSDNTATEIYDAVESTWAAGASMNLGRYQHRATTLNNGKILVSGGYNPSQASLTLVSCELYDPVQNTWTATGSLSNSRQRHRANLLPNGKVLITGGQQYSVADMLYYSLASAELFDPENGTWAPADDMGTARNLHNSVTMADGRVLVVGGIDGTGTVVSSAEIYDPVTGHWTATGSLAVARRNPGIALLPDNRILVAGGADASGNTLKSTEIYDPATGLWSATGDLNTDRQGSFAVSLPDGRILYVAGSSYTTNALASVEIYDSGTGKWTSAGSLTQARNGLSVTVLENGKVLVVGGTTDGINAMSSSNISWKW